MPKNSIYVGRGSVFGNPFKEGECSRQGAFRVDTGNAAFHTQLMKAFGDRKMTRQDCVDAYRIYLDYAGIPSGEGKWPEPKDLRGKNLACWCPLECTQCNGTGFVTKNVYHQIHTPENIKDGGASVIESIPDRCPQCQGTQRQPCHADLLLERANA